MQTVPKSKIAVHLEAPYVLLDDSAKLQVAGVVLEAGTFGRVFCDET
jgi:hypothetical protein